MRWAALWSSVAAWTAAIWLVYVVRLWDCFWASLFAAPNDPALQDCANRAQIGQFLWLVGALVVAALTFLAFRVGLLSRAWRRALSLPGRFPLRIVKTSILRALQANQRSPVGRPMTKPERCEKLAQEIDDHFVRMEALTPAQRRAWRSQHPIEFSWLHDDGLRLRDELGPYPSGRAPESLDRLLDRRDLTRPEAEEIRDDLRSIIWNTIIGRRG